MASANRTPTEPTESRAAKTLREIFESGRPLTYVRSAEEQRVGNVLDAVGQSLSPSTPVWTWTLTEGLHHDDEPSASLSPAGVLDFIVAHQGSGIFHLKDFHEPLRESPEIRRRLRDVYQHCLDQHKFVVITSPVRFIPEEIERSVMFVELRPPDLVELLELLREHGTDDLSEDVLHQLARALRGLTIDEARYALRRGIAAHGRLSPEAVPAVLEEKRLLVNRSGFIEYIPGGTSLAEVRRP